MTVFRQIAFWGGIGVMIYAVILLLVRADAQPPADLLQPYRIEGPTVNIEAPMVDGLTLGGGGFECPHCLACGANTCLTYRDGRFSNKMSAVGFCYLDCGQCGKSFILLWDRLGLPSAHHEIKRP